MQLAPVHRSQVSTYGPPVKEYQSARGCLCEVCRQGCALWRGVCWVKV